ncbi:MAG: hypothetical protein JRH19_06035 [Deltaproteobacteria bacterium]|nr:hypothetical protein [Deltaproteobacteria bacterium]
MKIVRELALLLLVAGLVAPGAAGEEVTRRFVEAQRFEAAAARQAVAAGPRHVYAIDNRHIQKLDKRSGVVEKSWEGPADGPVIHLNSGVVLEGRLYCAHSNYPGVPMQSSVEIFDAENLEHVGSHSFGISDGSATWVDRHDGFWWVAFAHYAGRGGIPGKGPEWTRLVQYDAEWRRVAGFALPPELIERLRPYSSSGGAWGGDGLLYVSGHDAPEVYALRLPRGGATLELVETLAAPIEGQGIALDPAEPGVLYGILRSVRSVVRSRLAED